MPKPPIKECPWINHWTSPHAHEAHTFKYPEHMFPETEGLTICPGLPMAEAVRRTPIGHAVRTLEVTPLP